MTDTIAKAIAEMAMIIFVVLLIRKSSFNTPKR